MNAIAVVVPARDEEELVGGCIAGIRRAAAHPALRAIPVHLVVVLDDCRDATAERVAEALARPGSPLAAATVIAVSARNVGAARALGAAEAFFTLGTATDPESVWLATTDADSVVPDDWLAHHLELWLAGAEGCAGTVVVDQWCEHPAATRPAFEAQYPQGIGHPHVHGTNLGVSMAAYLDAGGFARAGDR